MKIQKERLVTEFKDNPDGPDCLKGLTESRMFEVLWEGYDGKTVPFGHFTLAPFPGCCGVVISTDSFIQPGQRGQHYPSRWFHDIKAATARHFGYSCMIMTTQLRNFPEIVGAARSGWRFVHPFRNKRTNNDLGVAIKDI